MDFTRIGRIFSGHGFGYQYFRKKMLLNVIAASFWSLTAFKK
jgi:hypothetical protein